MHTCNDNIGYNSGLGTLLWIIEGSFNPMKRLVLQGSNFDPNP